jgi:hypothetical protein
MERHGNRSDAIDVLAKLTETVLELLVVETDLDRDGSVDQSDQSGGHSDEGGRSPVAGTDITGDVGNETTADDEEGLLSDESGSVEEVDNLLEGLLSESESV